MRALLVCVLVACGSPTTTPAPRTAARAHPATVTPPPGPEDNPTESECGALFAHALTLSIGDRKPSEADRTALAAELGPAFIADCRAGTRAYYRCGLEARTAADLATCK